MCGIAGAFSRTDFAAWHKTLPHMTAAIAHRGPDAFGHWFDPEAGIALGHRRLSIVDLSESGAQPMQSPTGRYVIVFNGEIYNHLSLRKRLEEAGNVHPWRGHSDTETLLAAIEKWGLVKALQASTGMFALAIWDRAERRLELARDRIGEKPLYYGLQGGALVFASELKAIKKAPYFRAEINRDALAMYFRYNAVPDPHCIFQGLNKLQPGCILSISAAQISQGKLALPVPYWSLAAACQRGLDKPYQGSDAEAVTEFDRLFARAITDQMAADVPLGAFLSGGVDSSAVVAMMQSQSSQKIKTFTIGFAEQGFNEADHARAVARHLGTEHYELTVSAQQAIAVVPELALIYDEPLADNSQIPTYLVSQLARAHVKVSLSGDAGDELFGGYNTYHYARRIGSLNRSLPHGIRHFAAARINAVTTATWDRLLQQVGHLLPSGLKSKVSGQRLHKLAALLTAENALAVFQQMGGVWSQECDLMPGVRPHHTVYDSSFDGLPNGLSDSAAMMALDILGYLPSDILVKVDRAAMAVGLETRVPLLDARIVEFSQQLPLDMKIRGGVSKWILRQSLYKRVPRDLIDRPKTGFSIPVGIWLRGALRQWAEQLLSTERLKLSGLINPVPVRQRWEQHLSGSHDWGTALWNVLMFQAWLEANIE